MRFCLYIVLIAALLAGCRDSVEDQASKLGDREFTTVVWATASSLQRGEMTASLLKKHDLKRSNGSDIVALLGRPTGYYDYDTNPAYASGQQPSKACIQKAICWCLKPTRKTAR
jgi:hypothetical protein